MIQRIRAAAFRRVCENHLPPMPTRSCLPPSEYNGPTDLLLLQIFSNEKSMQTPSGPSPHTALGGSVIELEDQENGQSLLESGASEAAPSPFRSPGQNTSAENDKSRKFGPADRSCDHFWPLSIRPFDLCARTPRSPSLGSTGPEPPFHHINFLGQRIFARSATPPEVSYWAAFLSTYAKPHRTFSRKGVIVAQANKFIDPFSYVPNGSEGAIEELCGSALLAALAGRVEKAYPNRGTWLKEREEEGDEAPICFNRQDLQTEPIYFWSTVPNHQLHRPHTMNKRDQHDLVINGPRDFTPPASRSYKNVAKKRTRRPSGLRTIIGPEEQEDLVDEVNAWRVARSQRWFANFAAKASRLSSATGVGDCDMGRPVEADDNSNPTGAKAECRVGQSEVELGAEKLAIVRQGLETLGIQEDSDSSDSDEDDFCDENIDFSDEDEDFPPYARKRHVSIHDSYTAVNNFSLMQVNGPVGPSQPVSERAINRHPAETMHHFSEEADAGLECHSDHGADFVNDPLHLPDVGTQYTSNFRLENTILDSSEDELALRNTSASPIQQEHLLPRASDVERTLHETSEERRARYRNLIQQRPQNSLPLTADDTPTISNLRSAMGSFAHDSSEERTKRIQHWVHQQQQSIRPELEEKHKLSRLEFMIEERKAAATLTASSLERGSGGVRNINRGTRHSKRSAICKKDESYLDHPLGGILWFLFLFVCFLYLWDLLP